MTQPLDRTCRIPQLGEIDSDNGEFWVENPFEMPEKGENLSAYERNRLYLNAGNLEFVNASFASDCDIDADSRTAVPFDYDNDGDEDLLVGSVGGGAIRLFRNQLPQQNVVKIRLKGKQSNASGIGSRVTLTLGDRKIVRDLFYANGFMGSGPAELAIGIGSADQIDEISIRWSNGNTQALKLVDANQVIVVTEGSSECERSGISVNDSK